MKTTLDALLKQITPLLPLQICKGEFADQIVSLPEYAKARSVGLDDETACGESLVTETGGNKEMAAYLTHAANVLPVLVEALEANLKCLTMDSDSEEDYAPEIEQIRQALAAAKEIDL